jgi:hypothetical protein
MLHIMWCVTCLPDSSSLFFIASKLLLATLSPGQGQEMGHCVLCVVLFVEAVSVPHYCQWCQVAL